MRNNKVEGFSRDIAFQRRVNLESGSLVEGDITDNIFEDCDGRFMEIQVLPGLSTRAAHTASTMALRVSSAAPFHIICR